MTFSSTDFEAMRKWIFKLPAIDFKIHSARVKLFDIYRYNEMYEELYDYVTQLGGKIQFEDA